MRTIFLCLLLTRLMVGFSAFAQPSTSKLSVNIPTVQQEATSVWRTINDIVFLEHLGYAINLPKAPLIDSLIRKSKEGTFGNDDYSLIYQLLEAEIYNEEDYKVAFEKVQKEYPLLQDILQQIETAKVAWDWEFKLYEQYDVVFTLYGSGGSYNPSTGMITLFTTKEGAFKNYESPANTIVHEIAHLGMEASLVEKYRLAHTFKERLVDQFVYVLFQEKLPNYSIQNMGDTRIEEYLKNKKDIAQLPTILEQFINEK